MSDLRPGEMICPKCGRIAESDTVDIGVGLQVRGNFRCYGCGWSVEPPTADGLGLTDWPEEGDL